MPEKETLERARKDKREGKAPSTQAGEFVREEIEHIREGKHGARSTKQAIAIGLSKARRAGVELPPSEGSSEETKEQAKRDLRKSKSGKKPSAKRSRATRKALKKEGRSAASKEALSTQARKAARKRSAASRSRSAKKAARTRKK
jgi:poly-gamma-glutamate capsule biosynthesis protein CapA/YwtB (metallophosphatase superfamily)